MMEKKDLFFSIYAFLFILLPFAVYSWRNGAWRIAKHLLYWTLITMTVYLIAHTAKGTFLPAEPPADRRAL